MRGAYVWIEIPRSLKVVIVPRHTSHAELLGSPVVEKSQRRVKRDINLPVNTAQRRYKGIELYIGERASAGDRAKPCCSGFMG
jgi:hypothetical protein